MNELNKSQLSNYFQQSISFDEYLKNFEQELLNGPEHEKSHYLPINQQRMKRVAKTFTPYANWETILENSKVTKWLIITEHWCGDSAQIIPLLHEIEKLSKRKIEMRLAYRDANPELMNAFLLNGARSIPRLIQMNESYEVTGLWGPRPFTAQELVKTIKADPATAPTYNEHLHKWYALDKGKSIQEEIAQLILNKSANIAAQ